MITRIEKKCDLTLIEHLAHEIMIEHYESYIPKEHILFYLNEYQSTEAIQRQINGNHNYYLISLNNIGVGYFCIEAKDNVLNLDKLYLLGSARGNELGKMALEFIIDYAIKNNFRSIELIVNQKNLKAISFYENFDFKIVNALTTNYSNGHSEADYKMERIFG